MICAYKSDVRQRKMRKNKGAILFYLLIFLCGTFQFTCLFASATLEFSGVTPANGSTNIPVSISSLSLVIRNPDGTPFNYSIQTQPNIGSKSVTEASNGTKAIPITGLSNGMTYRWYVNATDGTSWTRQIYTFTTASSSWVNQPVEFSMVTPSNKTITNYLNLQWGIIMNDPDRDAFSWTIECSNGQKTNGVGASDGFKSLNLTGFTWSTTYTVWVNATDGSSWTRQWYTFTTNKDPSLLQLSFDLKPLGIGIIIGLCVLFGILLSFYLFKRHKNSKHRFVFKKQKKRKRRFFFKKRKRSKTRNSPQSEPLVRDEKSVVLVKNLSRIKGDKEILTDINLDLRQGKLYAITGPSGSGKSRLMESIVGRETPTTGIVEISGIDIYKERLKATRLFGFVPQRPELNMYQTPVENMMNSAIQWSVENPEKKIHKLLGTVGLQDRKNVKAGDLSGGQQKRLSIAMELLKEPPIIFLDEPTTGLDPEIQSNIFSIIQGLNKEGTSIILTTHNVDEAEMADEIIIINKGRVATQGSAYQLASRTPGRGKIIQVELSEVSLTVLQCINEHELVKFMWRSGRYLRIFCNDPDVMQISNVIISCGGKIDGIKLEKTSIQDIFRFYTGKAPDE